MSRPEWLDLMSALPFCITGKLPAFNFQRLIETVIIAGVTMFGTVQVTASKVEAQTLAINTLAATINAMDDRLRTIEVSRAQRTAKLDGEIAEQSRNNADHEARLRQLERRRQ